MKNFILGFGRFFINFSVVIEIIAAIFISFCTGIGVSAINNEDIVLGILAGLGSFIVLFIILIMCNFILYLLLGMHDSFVSMSESLARIAQNNESVSFDAAIKSSDEIVLKCPNCGTIYNDGDKFCEKCGTKLN